MKQLTKQEAIALFDSREWQKWTSLQKASFQMVQEKLCMPFDEFQNAVEKVLERPVWTHEFGLNREGLTKELAGLSDAPTMDEIMALIPEHQNVLVLQP